MSLVTDTTKHKNEVRLVVLTWQRAEAWIPAFAGMTGGFETHPYGRFAGGYFQGNHSCSLAACTTSNENGRGTETDNHKGCPYNGFVGAYFHTNRSCRLSPTPPIMKTAVRAIRESPLRENGRGLFSEESLMSVVTDTTNHENGIGLFILAREMPGTGFRPSPE